MAAWITRAALALLLPLGAPAAVQTARLGSLGRDALVVTNAVEDADGAAVTNIVNGLITGKRDLTDLTVYEEQITAGGGASPGFPVAGDTNCYFLAEYGGMVGTLVWGGNGVGDSWSEAGKPPFWVVPLPGENSYEFHDDKYGTTTFSLDAANKTYFFKSTCVGSMTLAGIVSTPRYVETNVVATAGSLARLSDLTSATNDVAQTYLPLSGNKTVNGFTVTNRLIISSLDYASQPIVSIDASGITVGAYGSFDGAHGFTWPYRGNATIATLLDVPVKPFGGNPLYLAGDHVAYNGSTYRALMFVDYYSDPDDTPDKSARWTEDALVFSSELYAASLASTNYTDSAIDSLAASMAAAYVPWAQDCNGNLTAVTIGYRTKGEDVGVRSFTQGEMTTASGGYSRAEGFGSHAEGDYSHAEGHNTVAQGAYSHAEGIGTTALMDGSHAQGMYNYTTKNTLHSVGFGMSNNNRRNAEEIWLSGEVYIYGVGGYNGINGVSGVNDLATTISAKADATATLYATNCTAALSGSTLTYTALSNTVGYVQLLAGTNTLHIVPPAAIPNRIRDFGITVATIDAATITLDTSVEWHFDADSTNVTAGAFARIYCTESPTGVFTLQKWEPDSSQAATE